MRNQNNQGFTLIELLVVIAIIGVLASIILGSLAQARAKARDARRITDIRTIQQALEIYYLDEGVYPNTNAWIYSSGTAGNQNWANLENILGVTLPKDPINNGTFPPIATSQYSYAYGAFNSTSQCAGQGYWLLFNLETQNVTNDGFVWCNGQTYEFGNTAVVGVGQNKEVNYFKK